MIPTGDGLLVQRLFERLLASVDGDGRGGPLTIGDLYQRLIPYRSIRSEIGVMELASYEHGLLRLLGGEGGYLEVEGDTAAEEIRRELASPNPILGIYRDYADVSVRIVGASTATAPGEDAVMESAVGSRGNGGTAATGAPESPRPGGGQIVSAAPADAGLAQLRSVDGTAVEAGSEADRRQEERANPAAPVPNVTPIVSPDAPAVCTGCASSLPSVSGIRFCPYCGQVREPFPCGRCGTRLEPEWNYCIRCGAPADP